MLTPQTKIADESIIGSRDAVGFVLRLGRALHAYGIPAHRLEEVIWIVIAGALATGGSRVGVKFFGPEIGVFLGALTVGVASNWYARLLTRPATITQVPGILLLVPGSVGFRGLAALMDEKTVSGIDTTFKMVLTAVALVAGTLMANIVAPPRREI